MIYERYLLKWILSSSGGRSAFKSRRFFPKSGLHSPLSDDILFRKTGELPMKTEQHSFTMIELITVVAIIAVLAGIAVGVTNLVLNKSAEAKTEATIKALEIALNMYKDKFGHYPAISITPNALSIEDFTILEPSRSAEFEVSLWKFLDQKLINSATVANGNTRYFKDGWDRPLLYRSPGHYNKTTFDLGSVGPDGRIGDGGTPISTPADITSSINTDYNANFGKGDDIVNFIHNAD